MLAHKLRKATAEEMKDRIVSGKGETVEADGGCFGGCMKPPNRKEDRKDLRFAANQNGKHKVVVIIIRMDGACTNQAEFFLPPAPPDHHIAGAYLCATRKKAHRGRTITVCRMATR